MQLIPSTFLFITFYFKQRISIYKNLAGELKQLNQCETTYKVNIAETYPILVLIVPLRIINKSLVYEVLKYI